MTNTDRFTIRAAVYLILIKDEKVLLLRRFNTPWRNGEYTLPAGHVDGGEPIRMALCREAKEEVGIVVKPADLKFAHVMHQYENYEYVDLYFVASSWEGEPTNCEPEKCDELRWAPLHDLPANVIPNVKQALTSFADNNYYSEFGW
jgi:mutator protein MutT